MKLIKLHRNFLINKLSVILLILIFFIGSIVNFISIININKEYNWFESKYALYDYLNSFVLFYKLVVINLISYIWGSFFTSNNNNYHLLVTGYKLIKFKFIFSKVFLLVIYTFIIIITNTSVMLLIVNLCGNFSFSYKIILETFVNLLFICLIYGLLSSIFSLLFDHQYAFFVSVGMYVFGELIRDGLNGKNIYYVFFPVISNILDEGVGFGICHLVVLCMIYFFIVLFSYLLKK